MSLRTFAKRFAGKKTKQDDKYQNTRMLCTLNHSHRSKLESALCEMLRLRELAGEIRELTAEVRVLICGPEGHECDHKRKIESIVDFRAIDVKTGEYIFFEAKGFLAPTWPIKRRLWMHNRSERLEIYKGRHPYPKLDEVINA